MKRLILLLSIIILSSVAEAQLVQTQKSTFIAKEGTNIFHANQVTATNTKTGVTLVVWEKVTAEGRQILGRLVNAKGIPASPRFVLVSSNGAHPAIVYNPTRNEFLFAYDDNPQVQLTRSDVYVMRLNAQGRPASVASKVSTDTVSSRMGNFYPRFTFNPRNSTYVILWLREIANAAQATEGNNGLVGALLNPSGSVNGSAVLLQKTVIESNRLWGPIPQDAAFHPGNGKLLVGSVQVQSGTEGRKANYYLGTLNADLTGLNDSSFKTVNSALVDITGGFAWGSRIAFLTDNLGMVYFVDSNNIRRRKVDAAGKLSGAPVTALRPPKNNTRLFYPAVAFQTIDSVRRGILIAIENLFSDTGQAVLWAQPLDANGAALGAPVKVDTTSSTDTAITTQIGSLPPVVNMNGFRFAAFYTLAQFTSPGQTFQTSGIVKLNLTIPAN